MTNNHEHPNIHKRGDYDRTNFSMLPDMAERELTDKNERSLYWHYVSLCWDGKRQCIETVIDTAKACGFSPATLREARQGLADKGYIKIVQEGRPRSKGDPGQPFIIELVNRWAENAEYFMTDEQRQERLDNDLRRQVKNPERRAYIKALIAEEEGDVSENARNVSENARNVEKTARNVEKTACIHTIPSKKEETNLSASNETDWVQAASPGLESGQEQESTNSQPVVGDSDSDSPGRHKTFVRIAS